MKHTRPTIRRPAPEIDAVQLAEAFDAWVGEQPNPGVAFHFGLYESTGRSQAASGAGLHGNAAFLKMLLHIVPCAQINPAVLRACFLRHPKLNSSTLRSDLWAGGRAERVTTMLYHLRRLKSDSERLRQALAKCSPVEARSVQMLLKESHSEDYDSEAERHLQEHVSVDSDGFPAMLATQESEAGDPKETVSKKHKPAPFKSQASSVLDMFGSALKDAEACAKIIATGGSSKAKDGILKKPVAQNTHSSNSQKHTSMKKPASVPVPMKKPACVSAPKPSSVEDRLSETWGLLSVTLATKQSYIQYTTPEGKKKYLVGCSEGMAESAGKHHHDIVKTLLGRAKEPGMTQDALTEMRNELLGR